MNSILIVASFVFLSVLLGAGVIYSRIHWIIKATMISLTLLFGLMFYIGLTGLLGYPVIDAPPELFRYLASAVREPTTEDAGAIYLWYLEGRVSQLPRAIILPYSKELREKMAEAKRRSQHGPVFMGQGKSNGHDNPNGRNGHGEHPGNANGQGGTNQSSGTNGQSAGGSTGSTAQGNALDFKTPPDTVPHKD